VAIFINVASNDNKHVVFDGQHDNTDDNDDNDNDEMRKKSNCNCCRIHRYIWSKYCHM
jgi:hypothetical protein